MKEAEDKTASILPEWETQPQYGYWAALNRLGKAQKITGCMAHETLMPIPDFEIRINQNMTQNTGY